MCVEGNPVGINLLSVPDIPNPLRGCKQTIIPVKGPLIAEGGRGARNASQEVLVLSFLHSRRHGMLEQPSQFAGGFCVREFICKLGDKHIDGNGVLDVNILASATRSASELLGNSNECIRPKNCARAQTASMERAFGTPTQSVVKLPHGHARVGTIRSENASKLRRRRGEPAGTPRKSACPLAQ